MRVEPERYASIPAMPLTSSSPARSSDSVRNDAGSSLPVPTPAATTLRQRSGCASMNCTAVYAPIESPQTCARSMPSASSSPSSTATWWAHVYSSQFAGTSEGG